MRYIDRYNYCFGLSFKKKENSFLYFIEEFNNSQEITELSNHLLTTLANQNNENK